MGKSVELPWLGGDLYNAASDMDNMECSVAWKEVTLFVLGMNDSA